MRNLYLASSMLTLFPAVSFGAVDWNAAIGYERGFSDNVRLASTNERTDSSDSLTAVLNMSADESAYQLEAGYDFVHESWQHDTFDTNSEVQGNLLATAALIQNRLSWFINHNQSVSRVESQLPDTPGNREERTVLSTGPTYTQRLTDRANVQIRSVYSKVDLEESSQSNSNRVANSFTLGYSLSPLSIFNATLSSEKANFYNNKLSNYDRESVVLGVSGSKRLFDYSVSIGGNKIKPKIGEEETGKYVNASLTKEINRTNLSLEARKELTDSIFGADSVATSPGSASNEGLTNFFEVEIIDREVVSASIAHAFIPNRFNSVLNVSFEQDESVESNNIDQQALTVVLDIDYALGPRTNVFAGLERSVNKFKNQDPARKDELELIRLGVSRLFGARIDTSFQVQYQANESNLADSEYEEYSATFNVNYLLIN